VRYWGILAAKLAVAAAFLYAVWLGLHQLYDPPAYIVRFNHPPFLHDLKWTGMVLLFFLLVQGVLFLVVWDQRYRCRTCGRRLRMPVLTGRYAQMLLYGQPKLEYICTYGHGTLKVPELHIGGNQPSDWKRNDDDIWKELYSYDEHRKE
jgi:hypothetical protein